MRHYINKETFDTENDNNNILEDSNDIEKYNNDIEKEDNNNDQIININTKKDGYPTIDINNTPSVRIPDEIWDQADEIKDVPADGSCGYYSIQLGLSNNGISYNKNINKFQRTIYNHFARTDMNKFYPETRSVQK